MISLIREAFRGNAVSPNLQPTYDKAQGLYDTIASLINVGTALLQSANAGVLTPTTQDVVFGGNAAAWIKFGHAIKARLALHQSKGSTTMAGTVLTEAAQSFTANKDNARYIFGTAQTSANTWYQFYRDRPGDENFTSSTLAADMLADNDPRYGAFDLDSTVGTTPFSYYNKINSPVEFITYDELLFASAEATLRSGGTVAAAQALYQAGITANAAKFGVPQICESPFPIWLHNGTLPASSDCGYHGDRVEISGGVCRPEHLNPEAWVLWRRTGALHW